MTLDLKPPSPPTQTSGAQRRSVLWALLLGGVALSGGALGLQIYRTLANPGSPRETVVRDTSAVVAAVQQLARLESVAFHMERVIDIRDRQSHLFGLFHSEDALLLIAAVDVVAGVDLAQLAADDIHVDPVTHSVRVVLPAARVLSAHLDNGRTYVYSRSTDKLALPAPSLETRARQEAERTLRDAALEAGILERARLNAEQTVRGLLLSLAFSHVDVTSQHE